MPLNKDCIQYAGNKKDCPVSQNGKTYRIINTSGSALSVYEVDPCLISDKLEKKCDYLILVDAEKEGRAFLVELKGSDISSAIQQIENALKILGTSLKGYRIFGRVVGRRITPNIRSRRSMLEEKLRSLGGNLQIVAGTDYREIV